MFEIVRRAKRNQKGFTLVELVVTVLIIGLLVAIAVPLYRGVQTNTANQANKANIRIIDGAIAMYLAENPTGTPTAGASGNLVTGGFLQEWPTPPNLFPSGSAYTITGTAPAFRAAGPADL